MSYAHKCAGRHIPALEQTKISSKMSWADVCAGRPLPCHLQLLPAEIRLQIYGYLHTEVKRYGNRTRHGPTLEERRCLSRQLLRVNSQLYKECSHVLYSSQPLRLDVSTLRDIFIYVPNTNPLSSSRIRALVKEVEIIFHREDYGIFWDSDDCTHWSLSQQFANHLVPSTKAGVPPNALCVLAELLGHSQFQKITIHCLNEWTRHMFDTIFSNSELLSTMHDLSCPNYNGRMQNSGRPIPDCPWNKFVYNPIISVDSVHPRDLDCVYRKPPIKSDGRTHTVLPISRTSWVPYSLTQQLKVLLDEIVGFTGRIEKLKSFSELPMLGTKVNAHVKRLEHYRSLLEFMIYRLEVVRNLVEKKAAKLGVNKNPDKRVILITALAHCDALLCQYKRSKYAGTTLKLIKLSPRHYSEL